MARRMRNGGIRVPVHAVNRFKERCSSYVRKRAMTANRYRQAIRQLIREGTEVEVPLTLSANKIVEITWRLSNKSPVQKAYVLLRISSTLDDDWDIVTIISEEMYRSH